MQAIILAAGKGKRIHELTGDTPKCLLSVNGETLIERELRLLNEVGIENNKIFIVTGYQNQKLDYLRGNKIFNCFYEKKDNSYSLFLGLQHVQEEVIVLDADLCFDKEALICLLDDSRNNILLSKKASDLSESTGIITSNDKVVAIGKQYRNTGFVYISIFKIGIDTIPDFKKALVSDESQKTWYTKAITEICQKHKFFNKVFDGRWHEVDDQNDYYETLEIFNLGDK